jgi:hypothetical protein
VTCPLKRVPKNSLESLEKEIRDEEEELKKQSRVERLLPA